MINTETLDEWARKLAGSLPQGVTALKDDVEKNLRAGLEGLIQRLDLVTREEYEVQTAVLTRTREKVEALERRIAEIEAGNKAGMRSDRQ
ncbi:MAG: accessory factor UbiK family protein [Gammaproteobacteria bacterium]